MEGQGKRLVVALAAAQTVLALVGPAAAVAVVVVGDPETASTLADPVVVVVDAVQAHSMREHG